MRWDYYDIYEDHHQRSELVELLSKMNVTRKSQQTDTHEIFPVFIQTSFFLN